MIDAYQRANQLFPNGSWSETIQALTVDETSVVIRMRVSAQGVQRDATGHATIELNNPMGIADAMDLAHFSAMTKALDSFMLDNQAQPPVTPPVQQHNPVATYQEGYRPPAEVGKILCQCQREMHDTRFKLGPKCAAIAKQKDPNFDPLVRV